MSMVGPGRLAHEEELAKMAQERLVRVCTGGTCLYGTLGGGSCRIWATQCFCTAERAELPPVAPWYYSNKYYVRVPRMSTLMNARRSP